MDRRGFTLIELLIVITIIGILVGLSSLYFSRMVAERNVEKQTRELYADLMLVRQQAQTMKMTHRAKFTGSNLTVRRYTDETDTTGTVVLNKTLSAAAPTLSSWASPSATEIEFNEQGIMPDPIPKSVCFYSSYAPSLDSLVILQTRISMGRIRNQAITCGRPNIDIK